MTLAVSPFASMAAQRCKGRQRAYGAGPAGERGRHLGIHSGIGGVPLPPGRSRSPECVPTRNEGVEPQPAGFGFPQEDDVTALLPCQLQGAFGFAALPHFEFVGDDDRVERAGPLGGIRLICPEGGLSCLGTLRACPGPRPVKARSSRCPIAKSRRRIPHMAGRATTCRRAHSWQNRTRTTSRPARRSARGRYRGGRPIPVWTPGTAAPRFGPTG
jgi:hypothetical protein